MEKVGEMIAQLRKRNGWTQAELAEKLCVSDKAVSKWENGNGMPEISQLPAMAALFNVTIDYLMTGKAPEKEIVIISKAELCAKNDDVALAEEVKDLPKDENNKNIVDYILQYKSLNVFKKLCETDPQFIKRFTMLDVITLAVVSNSLSLLSGKEFYIDRNCRFTFENEDEIKSLLPIEDKEYFRNYQDQCICLIPRDFFTLLVTDKRIKEATLNVLLSNQNGRECVWYHAFPYIIDEAYKVGNDELLLKLLEISRKNNAIAYETVNPTYNRDDGSYGYELYYFFIAPKYGNKGHGLVRILESTIKAALEKGDFDMVQEFNNINIDVDNFVLTKFGQVHDSMTKSKCYVANADEIRVAKLKLDKSSSEDELKIQKAIHNGILNINELKEVKDLNLFKKAINKYPIHIFERLYQWYRNKNWHELFCFSIDNGDSLLADALMSNNISAVEKNMLAYWKYEPGKRTGELFSRNVDNELQSIVSELRMIKEEAIKEQGERADREQTTAELTKDYFYSELNKGNKELVIIKLCVCMEAILKRDYRYEGDFSEMLDGFCSQFNLAGRENLNCNHDMPRMLNDLRKQRNGIVHSEKSDVSLSDEELKSCIDYICSL